ncbi:PhzF family phenazine biosynthesis protein [Providencia stuartii]|uniref:PhzF family phenazine biosynthesis protein n=1 Tax=unclassified Providencia TaxID=2633465 RepID=UPI00234B69C6|nr:MULTISPECIES: PhzF family phenazine biosynthesis protein [unclassified Providencia]ELR5120454.1 PhzF family phenazine biosynthesis protein [Providencia stuartii]
MSTTTFPVYYVDAFTQQQFHGNPAAIVLLETWLPDDQLMAIAAEINLSETAFLVGEHIRWFTPNVEVKLCGHATLAAAFILHQFKQHPISPFVFQSLSGELIVYKNEKGFTLDFPVLETKQVAVTDHPQLTDILGGDIESLWLAKDRYVCFLSDANQVANCTPNLSAMAALPLPGLTITALSDNPNADFVSRYFAPAKGVDEDPVTGTSHCAIAPLWAARLNKNQLIGHQISARGGVVLCSVDNERVKLTGEATLFLTGNIHI